MANIQLAYKGKRLSNSGRLYHYYYKTVDEKVTDETICFAKPLSKFHSVGVIAEFEETKTGVKGAGVDKGLVSKELIMQWSIEEKEAILLKDKQTAAKIKPDGHVDKFIKDVEKLNLSYSAKKNLALYLYGKILSL